MVRAVWPLADDRPIIQVDLLHVDGQSRPLRLLADSGAGRRTSRFQLLLTVEDCVQCGGFPGENIPLGGAYRGAFPVYIVRIRIPALDFEDYVRAVAVETPPDRLDGIACFRFLNQFGFGNFGDSDQFGLEA